MGRKRCVRAIARIAVTVALVTVVFLILGESRPARAGWTEYGISGAPMCPGSGCATLELSCQSAAYQYWGSNWPGKVISVRMKDYRSATCEILRVGSWPIGPYGSTLVPTNSTCSNTQMAWSDTGCVPYITNPKKDCGADCDPGVRNGPGAANVVPDTIGNPIDPGAARKFQRVVDFTTGGPKALAFIRYYDTMYTDYSPSSTVNKYALGFVWHSNFHSPKVFLMPGTSNLYVVERAGGQLLVPIDQQHVDSRPRHPGQAHRQR